MASTGLTLHVEALREALGKTQVDVAHALDIDEWEVNRVERRAEDAMLSTLTRYGAAIGDKLEVAVVIGGRRYKLDV